MVLRDARRVVLELDVVLHHRVVGAQAPGVVPVLPPAVLPLHQPALGGHPHDAVAAFGEAVHPVVDEAAAGALHRVQLPFRAIAQRAAPDAIGARPRGDPDVAVPRLQHVVDECVAQPFGDVVRVPLAGLLVEEREPAAVRAHGEPAVLQPAHVEDAVGKQPRLDVEQLEVALLRVVADHAAGGADPERVALQVHGLHVALAHAEVREGLRGVAHRVARALRGARGGFRVRPGLGVDGKGQGRDERRGGSGQHGNGLRRHQRCSVRT